MILCLGAKIAQEWRRAHNLILFNETAARVKRCALRKWRAQRKVDERERTSSKLVSVERRRIKAGGRQQAENSPARRRPTAQRVFIDRILRKALALASAIEKPVDGS